MNAKAARQLTDKANSLDTELGVILFQIQREANQGGNAIIVDISGPHEQELVQKLTGLEFKVEQNKSLHNDSHQISW